MVSLDDGKYVDSYNTSQLEREWRRRLNSSTIVILFNDCRLGVSLLTTAATRSYQYRATDALPFYVLKCRKAQKQRGFWAKSTYGHHIKDEVLIDTARVSGLYVMYSLNLLTMGVAEPVAECQPRICDGRKPDIGVMSEPVQEESNLIADRSR